MNFKEIITPILWGTTIFFLSSCRITDIENTLSSGGVSVVSFNLLGTDYADSGKSLTQAFLSKNGIMNSENQVQSQSVLVGPSHVMKVELSSVSSSSKLSSSASLGLNSRAAIDENPITSGVKFRILTYRQSNGNYHTHQDYTVGQPTVPMMLDHGVAYDIVAYSFGTSTLPVISSGEQNNINSANVNYDDNNRDFMYQKLPFTPNGNINNILNLTLRHKVMRITTVVSSGNVGFIQNITGGLLSCHYRDGVFSLSSGNLIGRTTQCTGVPLTFSGFGTTTATADPVLINNNTNGLTAGSFSANVNLSGTTKPISFPNSFKITPENNSVLTINFKTCGAYIGPNTNTANFKLFMCHNLGADTTLDPFAPSKFIHGGKYQWGSNGSLSQEGTNTVGQTGVRWLSQATDQAFSSVITGWNPDPLPNGTWSDASKTINDPCPVGYRVPTFAQLQSVIANNTIERVGTWTDSATNYSSALYFKTPSGVRT